MDERRFTDEEVEEIFRAAASSAAPGRDLAPRQGMTLAELQEIGREVGIPPERIAVAAGRLHQPPALRPRGTVLGMPVSVGRTVDLPRAPTDREWSILVGELRETFHAHGRESATPTTRSWNNGNLRVVVEPTETGYRLRMGTRKSEAAGTLALGLFSAVVALLLLLEAGGASGAVAVPMLLALMALGAFSYNAVRLPLWASERDRQMEHVADRMLALLARAPAEVSDGGEPQARSEPAV